MSLITCTNVMKRCRIIIMCCNLRLLINASLINTSADWWNFIPDKIPYQTPRLPTKNLQRDTDQKRSDTNLFKR